MQPVFLSIPLLVLEIYTVHDPREGYPGFRRTQKYRADVQLTDSYLAFVRYGALFSLVLYSSVLIAAGEGIVRLLAFLTVALLFIYMKLEDG